MHVDKCKFMDSKKIPLWLVLENRWAPNPVSVIFKSGDDLRQDMLTLQMIRLMDSLWKHNQLDLCMSPYEVIATGHDQGLIQVVMNAESTSSISKVLISPLDWVPAGCRVDILWSHHSDGVLQSQIC